MNDRNVKDASSQFDLREKLNSIRSSIEDITLKLGELSNQLNIVSSDLEDLREQIDNSLDNENSSIDLDNYGAVSIVNHPNVEKLKMLFVLDNVISQGIANGLKREMDDWFVTLDDEVISNYDLLYASYINQLNEIVSEDDNLSFSSSILDDEKTIVATYGNKNIYSYSDGEIFVLDLPPSVNYSFIKSSMMDNNDYTTIMLLSDGNVEEIEDNKVKVITNSTNRDLLAEELLESTQEENNKQIL